MNYWLNVHWPPYEDEHDYEQWNYWVFLAEGYEQLAQDLQVGDRAFIYETKYAPRRKTDAGFIGQKRPGNQGIVALVEIIGELQKDPNAKLEKYEDGRELCWKFHAETKLVKEKFCPLAIVREALGYKPKYYFRIPGGLRKLTKAQFDSLVKQFVC